MKHTELNNSQSNKEIPDHHRRYAIAWSLYQDADCSEQSRMLLAREMDDAQNHFTWDEFQSFKETLPGYIDYWEAQANSLLDHLNRKFKN